MLIYTFANKRNPHKKIELHVDGHRHYSVRQYMEFENGVKNLLGDGKLHRWKHKALDELLEDYDETTFDDCLFANCSYCGDTHSYLMSPSERKLVGEYYWKGREMGMLQDLFPKIPDWIRSGVIDKYSNGFCICPKCQKGE